MKELPLAFITTRAVSARGQTHAFSFSVSIFSSHTPVSFRHRHCMHAPHRPPNFATGRHAASVGQGGTRPDMEGQCVVEPRGVCVLFLVAVGDDIRKSWPFSWPATFRKKWPVGARRCPMSAKAEAVTPGEPSRGTRKCTRDTSHGHTDHTEEPHNHPNPPTHPHDHATAETAADSTAAGPAPTAPRGQSGQPRPSTGSNFNKTRPGAQGSRPAGTHTRQNR